MTVIVGAGIAGLLAANLLHRRDPIVHEAQPSLPNNHSAVLRFRSSVIGDVLGIPFRRVEVVKASLPWRNPIADQLAYSAKVAGVYRSDRSIPIDTTKVERWIAPPDLISQMARNVKVVFSSPWSFDESSWIEHGKVISTIPMPVLARALGYERFFPPEDQPRTIFSYVNGINLTARIADCDAFASLYVPDPVLPFSRVSITGDQLIVEISGIDDLEPEDAEHQAHEAARLMGVRIEGEIEAHLQRYAKIVPIDEGERRRFIHWASTIQGKAFSLGRFATWRPTLLADDLVKDLRVIEKLMDSSSPEYDAERIEREVR